MLPAHFSTRPNHTTRMTAAVAAATAVASSTALASTVVLDNTSGLTVGPTGSYQAGDFNNYESLVSFQTSTAGARLDSISLFLSANWPQNLTGIVTVSLIETTTNAYTGTVVATEDLNESIQPSVDFHTFEFTGAIAQTSLAAGTQYSLRIDGSAFQQPSRVFVRSWASWNTPAMNAQEGFSYAGSWSYNRNLDSWGSTQGAYGMQLTATAVPGAGGLLAGIVTPVLSGCRRRRRGRLSG